MGLLDGLLKIAKSYELKKLIEAKQHSDKNEYAQKHKILSELLEKHPEQFKVNSILDNKYVGLTHKRTGFRIHAPRTLIPVGIENEAMNKKAHKERVRVVLPYEGQYLMERLSNPAWPKNFGRRRFVGGGIERGETPAQAASRELMEELGLHVKPEEFETLGFDPKESHHYLKLNRHGLSPGTYKAEVGSDPFINLEKGSPEGADYWGADLNKLQHK